MASPLWSDHHRDPSFLWPLSAIAALTMHGLVGWWLIPAYSARSAPDRAVIRVVALPSNQAIADTTPTAVSPTGQPLTVNPSPATATPTPASPAPLSSPAPIPAAPQFLPDRPPSPPATATPITAPPQPDPAPITAPPSPPSGPGLQLFWSVVEPAQLQLPDDLLTDFLSIQDACVVNQDWSQGSVTVGLRITVETNGQLSQAIQPLDAGENAIYSDSSAYRDALICLSQRRFLPALAEAFADQTPSTREVRLEVTASPRL